MSCEYIKIMSRANTQSTFIPDTECFLFVDGQYVRPTIHEFVHFIGESYGDFLGRHIVASENEATVRNLKVGQEIWDLEWCEDTEFYFLSAYEPKTITQADIDLLNKL